MADPPGAGDAAGLPPSRHGDADGAGDDWRYHGEPRSGGGGVGARRQPPVWMKEGDLVEIEVSKIGVLCNRVEREKL